MDFNKDGQLEFTHEYIEARREFWDKVRPMIERMNVLELRAMMTYLDFTGEITGIILRKER